MRVGQDVRVEDVLRNHQDKTAVAGNDIGNGAIARQQGHLAKDVALQQFAEHQPPAGAVRHRNLSVAADEDAKKAALVAAFDNRFATFEGPQFAFIGDLADPGGIEALE